MRVTYLLAVSCVLAIAAPGSAGASAGADARECGPLAGTRSAQLTAYSVSCSKAAQVVRRAVGTATSSSRPRSVRGTFLGYSCRGAASRRRISVSCRRGGGAQFITARGAV